MIPSIDDLAQHRWDRECYEVAAALAHQYPNLSEDAGFYVHPTHGPGDHGWNVTPDGTIVDMTATQHDYEGEKDEQDEGYAFPAPAHPEIIPPDHPYYPRYVSWTRNEQQAQNIAHDRGEHYDDPKYYPACPQCQTQQTVASILSGPIPAFPPKSQKIGASLVEWWSPNPGDAIIMAHGGTSDDRTLAEQMVKAELEAYGYRRVAFTVAEDDFQLPRFVVPCDNCGRPLHHDGQQSTGCPCRSGAVTEEAPPPEQQHAEYPVWQGVREALPQGWNLDVLTGGRGQYGTLIGPGNARGQLTLEAPNHPPSWGRIQTQPLPDGSYGYHLTGFGIQPMGTGVGRHVMNGLGNWVGQNNSRLSWDAFNDVGAGFYNKLGWNVQKTPWQGHDPNDPDGASYYEYTGQQQPVTASRRHSSWDEIMAKAKRLVQSGQVYLLRNGYNSIVGHVIGDHGEYMTEIGRDDPQSRAITTWQCECPWDQYAWQRTRQWKKYEGRPCSHVLALYWKSLMTPFDEDQQPGQGAGQGPGQSAPPGNIPGGGGAAPMPPAPDGTIGPPGPGGQPPMGPPGQPGILPPAPMDQMQMMMQPPPLPGTTPVGVPGPPNSVSVPGARIPTPFSPTQYPGGTYSKTAAEEFTPPEIVRLVNSIYGLKEGREGATDAGQYTEIPAGSTGEVLSQDATTGWVEVIFPLDGGPMTSYHARCFCEPKDLQKTNVRPPGPFIRRRQ